MISFMLHTHHTLFIIFSYHSLMTEESLQMPRNIADLFSSYMPRYTTHHASPIYAHILPIWWMIPIHLEFEDAGEEAG